MNRNAHILLIEDNEGDILLTKEVFSDTDLKHAISVSRDGEEAIIFLTELAKNKRVLPDLVLLDINLPKIDGKEVLRYIKTTSELKSIPVIVFSTSSSISDISYSYENNANCYISKPKDFDKFTDLIAVLETFWLKVAQLPVKNNT